MFIFTIDGDIFKVLFNTCSNVELVFNRVHIIFISTTDTYFERVKNCYRIYIPINFIGGFKIPAICVETLRTYCLQDCGKHFIKNFKRMELTE